MSAGSDRFVDIKVKNGSDSSEYVMQFNSQLFIKPNVNNEFANYHKIMFNLFLFLPLYIIEECPF